MRRLFVLFMFVVLVAMTPLSAEAAKPKVMRIAHMTNEVYHMHRAMVQFQNELNATGKFQVEIYPSAQFGTDPEVIESIKAGDITMTVSPSVYFTDEAKGITLIELPYVFSSRAEAIKTLDGPWGQEQLRKLEPSGLYGLGYMENGLRQLTNSKRPIRTPEDLKGLKLRVMPVEAHLFFWNSLGCSSEGSPFSELYTNLATKVFDGQENGLAHTYSARFYEAQPYMSLIGHVYCAYILGMSLDFWNGLTAEEQDLVKKAYRNAYNYQLELIDNEEASYLEAMKNDKNTPVEINTLTPEEQKAFMDAAKPTHDKYRKELGDAEFDAFLNAIREAAKSL